MVKSVILILFISLMSPLVAMQKPNKIEKRNVEFMRRLIGLKGNDKLTIYIEGSHENGNTTHYCIDNDTLVQHDDHRQS